MRSYRTQKKLIEAKANLVLIHANDKAIGLPTTRLILGAAWGP